MQRRISHLVVTYINNTAVPIEIPRLGVQSVRNKLLFRSGTWLEHLVLGSHVTMAPPIIGNGQALAARHLVWTMQLAAPMGSHA